MYSKGPWTVERDGQGNIIIGAPKPGDDARYLWVAEAMPTHRGGPQQDEQMANARLIAQCPTMYEYIAKRAALGDNEAKQLMEVLGDATSKEPNWPPGGHVGQAEQEAP